MQLSLLLSCSCFYLVNSIATYQRKSAPPLLLVYETDAEQLAPEASNFIFQQMNELQTRDAFDDNVEVVGTGEEWKGWGSKAKHVAQRLSSVDPERLVIVSDSRDVLLNNLNEESVEMFVKNYQTLTNNKKDAIVVGAESQCCVSAMTHAQPGDYINDDLTRTSVMACNSGEVGCQHRGEEYQRPWVEQMKKLAEEKEITSKNIYPNAGIIVGTAKNILNVYNVLNMQETEDDQALFTDLMLKQNNLIVMDHEQKLIGNNIWTDGMDGCIFEWNDNDENFVHPQNKNSPALLHFQGKFYECYGKMASKLGYNGDMKRKLADAVPNNYQATVKYTQQLTLQHSMTLIEANNAVSQINSNKDALCTTIDHESTYASATCEDAFLEESPVNVNRLIRRLADDIVGAAERVIKLPITMEGDAEKEAELKSELENWAQSVPTNIANAANLHGGQSFQSSMTSPTKYKSSSSKHTLSIFFAIALCIPSISSLM